MPNYMVIYNQNIFLIKAFFIYFIGLKVMSYFNFLNVYHRK